MAITFDNASFSTNGFSPRGKVWGKIQIKLTDRDDETSRIIVMDVLLDASATATFQDHEAIARKEGARLLRLAADAITSP
ncbi:MAG: hypothetical protein WBF99_16220 [Xanthobacteraceae bacterium]